MGPRQPVPEPIRTQLIEATQAIKDARAERERLIIEALKAGASIREVSDLVGMNHRQVMEVGHRHNWPPIEAREERVKDRAESAKWRTEIEDGIARLRMQQELARFEKSPELQRQERPRSWEKDDPFEDER